MKPWSNQKLNEYVKESNFRRYGKCKNCGACCRVCCSGLWGNNKYSEFIQKDIKRVRGRGRNRHYIKTDCKNLTLNGKCKVFNRGLPSVCAKFPMSPDDGVYMIVKDFCGFRFKKLKKDNKVIHIE